MRALMVVLTMVLMSGCTSTPSQHTMPQITGPTILPGGIFAMPQGQAVRQYVMVRDAIQELMRERTAQCKGKSNEACRRLTELRLSFEKLDEKYLDVLTASPVAQSTAAGMDLNQLKPIFEKLITMGADILL